MNNTPWVSPDFPYSERFKYIASLEIGWLDKLNPPVSQQALVTAYLILSEVDSHFDTQPSIVPNAEGGIAIEDRNTGLDLEVFATGEIFVMFFDEDNEILDSKEEMHNPQNIVDFILNFKS